MKLRAELQARRAIAASRFDEAICAYKEILRSDPSNIVALSMVAQCFEWNSNPKKALEYANQVLSNDPYDLDTLLLAARCSREIGDEAMCYHYVCRAVENLPDRSPGLPSPISWLISVLSTFPFLRKSNDDLNRYYSDQKKQQEWAKEFKITYEIEYGSPPDASVH